ncbi:MAG: hypothetical protein K2V38_09720, partial [Gemmataceae bacterium]|nr:hypothetical protein [Gemmataceae bacterium]
MRLSLRYRLLVPLALLLVGDGVATAWAAAHAAAAAEQRIAGQLWAVAETLRGSQYPLKKPILDQVKGLSGAELLFVHPVEGTHATFPDPPPDPPVDVPPAGRDALGLPVTIRGQEYRCLRVELRERPQGGTLYVFYPEALRQEAVR